MASPPAMLPGSVGSVAHVAGPATYIGERVGRPERPRCNTVEAAMRWCGEDLRWKHYQIEQRSLLHGLNEKGHVVAVVRGPLVAVLPESIEVEVLSARPERAQESLDAIVDDLERRGYRMLYGEDAQ
jgi:hypothetical protein